MQAVSSWVKAYVKCNLFIAQYFSYFFLYFIKLIEIKAKNLASNSIFYETILFIPRYLFEFIIMSFIHFTRTVQKKISCNVNAESVINGSVFESL